MVRKKSKSSSSSKSDASRKSKSATSKKSRTSARSGALEKSAGIPRTRSAAQKLGYESVTVAFSKLGDEVQAGFVQLTEHGSRAGSLCGIAPSPDPRYWLVCYKDARKRCNWVRVPRGEPVHNHG